MQTDESVGLIVIVGVVQLAVYTMVYVFVLPLSDVTVIFVVRSATVPFRFVARETATVELGLDV